MRPTGSAEFLEQRRLRAISFLQDGLQPVEIARKSALTVAVSVAGKPRF
jgi:hypothetical protein